MTRSSSDALRPLLSSSPPRFVLRGLLLVWILAAALLIGLSQDVQPILSAPRGVQFLLFVISLAVIGSVAVLRSAGPLALLTATVAALALTGIGWMIGALGNDSGGNSLLGFGTEAGAAFVELIPQVTQLRSAFLSESCS